MNLFPWIRVPAYTVLIVFLSVSACNLTRGSALTDSKAIQIAYDYLAKEKAIADPARELPVRAVTTDELGLVHVNLDHVINDVPVWGEDFKVHLDKESRVYSAAGKFSAGLTHMQTTPRLSAQQARSELQKDYTEWTINNYKLVILPDFTPPVLAYVFSVTHDFKTQLIFVDANNGRIVKRLDGVTLE